MSATLRDVAARAGVSPATVSRVLNDTGQVPISAEIRERVARAIAETGYSHSRAPRRTRDRGGAQPAGRLGFLTADYYQKYNNPYFSPVMQAIESEIYNQGMSLEFGRPYRTFLKQQDLFQKQVEDAKIDGLIMVSTQPDTTFLHRIRPLVRHIVVTNAFNWRSDLTVPDIDLVGFDHEEAALQAMDHLVELGHRRIAFVGDTEHDRRYQGYRRALEAAGVPYDQMLVAHADFNTTSGYEATLRLLTSGAPLTAVFAVCDSVAFGAMRALHEAGLRVPSDVSVVSIDDVQMAEYTTPPLTTVHVPKEELGRWPVRLLAQRIKGERSLPVKIILPTELVIRQSTAAPPAR